MGSRFLPALFVLTLGLALPLTAAAQARMSERGNVSQVVNGTTITVDYARPGSYGRDIFGTVVHWGEMWTPGANRGTTLEVDNAIKLNGHDVPAGIYSVWMEPQPEEWTVHLHENPRLYHTQRPKHDELMLSFAVTPEEAPHLERLTFSFPDFDRNGTTLQMHWGTTSVSLEIEVESTLRIVRLTEEEMDPYLGRYTMKMYETPDDPPFASDVEFVADDGAIKGLVVGDWTFAIQLLPRPDPHEFRMAVLGPDGEIGEVAPADEGGILTFTVAQGKAVGFKVSGIGDETWIEGVNRFLEITLRSLRTQR